MRVDIFVAVRKRSSHFADLAFLKSYCDVMQYHAQQLKNQNPRDWHAG